MNVLRVTSILLLVIFICSTSCLKNDRSGSSFYGGPNFIRRSRRIELNEYLVPPPRPKQHPVRSGRVANPSHAEAPGYFSQLMSWLNPFNYGSPPPTPPQSSPHPEAPYPPPPPPPQPRGPPTFNPHPVPQPGPSHHPPLVSQSGASQHPPLGPPPSAQQPGPLYPPPSAAHPDAPLNLPPGPSLQLYYVPSANFQNIQHPPPPLKDNRGTYAPPNKGKPCNPCNRIPWIPMQNGGPHPERHQLPSQLSNGYLPPGPQTNYDAQHAASHEIRIPDVSQVPIEQNEQQSVYNNPMLYPGPVPPLYKAEPFDRPSQSPSYAANEGRFELPSLPVAPSADQEHENTNVNNERYNIHANNELKSIGAEISQGHISAISQNQETEISRGHAHHKETYDIQPSIPGPSFNQEYHNNPQLTANQGNVGVLDEYKQNTFTNYGSSNLENHNFANQNGDEYQDSFKSNPAHNTDPNYLPPDLNPSASFGSSTFHNQDNEGLNYQYSDDLSPSGSAIKDSHVTTQPPLSTYSAREKPIHFEESPLLDLSKKGEHPTDAQWSTTTVTYTSIDEISDNTLRTTTIDYNTETDKVSFEESSNFVRPTESYSSSDIQSINNVFGPSTSAVTSFGKTNRDHRTETSTIGGQYTNQQDVSYIPPTGNPGYLWPSLVLNKANLSNDPTKNRASLNHLAQENNSFSEIKDSGKQDIIDAKDGKDSHQRQQSVKRNKQVQVIIPYTSEYTPIPFQQSYGDWSVKTNFERTQPRKIPARDQLNSDKYLQQESRNDRLVNQLQSHLNFNDSNKSNTKSIRPSVTSAVDSRSATTKANNSIDVRRLQKNIDNWTIQEYSKPTTFSTILPSSLHPYLSPSKKIPTEYLTTTEPGDHTNESKDHHENVKTYSLAGFSFNEVEHEGSASNRVEETRAPIKVARVDSSKATASGLQGVNESMVEGKSTWEVQSASPANKERIYVVTPQSIPAVSTKNSIESQKGEGKSGNLPRTSEAIVDDGNNSKSNLSKFETIEKAYQVLPQAVNNLAIASTGKESVPLWGIMEHEEFASLNLDGNDEEAVEDIGDGPVLYSGHSKVSRAKR